MIRLLWGVRYTDLGPFRAVRWDALERVRDVAAMEAVVGGPPGLLVGLGGQGPNTIARALQGEAGEGVVLGTAVGDIAIAEDRGRHAALLARLGVGQPPWTTVGSYAAALGFVNTTGGDATRPVVVVGGVDPSRRDGGCGV